jgi:uncharacterized membrane protein YeiH
MAPRNPSIDILVHRLPELASTPVLLPALFDYTATFIWALSGALIAARRGYVGMGIVIIAIVSATGGGLLRDSMLSRTATLLTNPIYVLVAMAAVVLVVNWGRRFDQSRYIGPAVRFIDALGAGVYAVVGVDRAIADGLPFAGIVIVGVANATGGGLLRDVLMRRVPDLFKPGLPFGPASFLGATLFAVLARYTGLDPTAGAFITIATISVLDLIVLRLNIRSRPLEDFRAYWEGRD